jgi:hypothetical protein
MKYGVKLLSYDGTPMDMWVWCSQTNEPFKTTLAEVASNMLSELKTKNPKGDYQIRQFEE